MAKSSLRSAGWKCTGAMSAPILAFMVRIKLYTLYDITRYRFFFVNKKDFSLLINFIF